MQLGVQHIVLNLAPGEHTAQKLGDFYRGGTHQDRTALLNETFYLVDNRVVLLALGLIYQIVHVLADYRTIGGDADHFQFVDVPELARFGLGRTSHTGQLGVHAEIVLQGNRGVGLRGGFHLDPFLGFDSLVQTVRITAAFHDTARLLVHDLHLVVHHHVFHIALEQGVSLQQLINRMDTVGLNRVIAHDFGLLGRLFLRRHRRLLHFGNLRTHIGQHVVFGVVGIGRQIIHPFIGKVDAVELLVNHEIKLAVNQGHVLALFLQIVVLGLLHQGLHARFAQELDQGVVLGKPAMGAEQQLAAFLFLFGRRRAAQQGLGFGQNLGHQSPLLVVQLLDLRPERIEFLVFVLESGPGNDQRSTGIVNQDRIDLIDNGVVMPALHQFLRRAAHIVAQVVEAELVVGSVSDIGQVSLASRLAAGLVLVDAIHFKAVELEEHPHPFRVTLGQVVVDRHHMDALPGQRVEVNRQGFDQGLTFPGAHFGNLALMQHDTADKLHIVMHHVPSNQVAPGHPLVLVIGLVAANRHIVAGCGQIAVPRHRRHFHFGIVLETLGRGLHHRERFGKNLVQDILGLVVNFFF